MLLVLARSRRRNRLLLLGVTGNPLTMPQQVNRETYAMARYFYGQAAYPEPTYHHKVMRDFYAGLSSRNSTARTRTQAFFVQTGQEGGAAGFSISLPFLTIPLFLLPRIVRDRRIRFLMIAGAAGFVGSALVIFFNIHYVAPISSVILAVIVQGMRHLRTWRWEGRPAGLFLVRAIVVMCMVMIPVQAHILAAPPEPGTWAAIGPERAAIEARLDRFPGRSWCWCAMGRPRSPAGMGLQRSRHRPPESRLGAGYGADQNEELLRYYSTRRVWLLEADAVPPRLSEYSLSGAQISPKAEH